MKLETLKADSKEIFIDAGKITVQLNAGANAEVRGDAPLYGAASLSTDGLCSTVEAEK